MTNRIPLDIESVLEIGVDKWFDTFEWPFSWAEFVNLEDEVKLILKDHIERNPKYADVIVINYKIYIEYVNFIFALILKEKLGDRAIISDNNSYFQNIFKTGIPLDPIINFPTLIKKHTVKTKLKKLKKFVLDNKFRIVNNKKAPVYILEESRSNHTLEYLQKKHLGQILPISFFDFFNNENKTELTEGDTINIKKIVTKIKEDIIELIHTYSIETSDIQEKFIEEHTFQLFETTKTVLESVKINIGDKKIKLFIAANNNYYSRILSVAIRDAGGEIHGFKHGEPINYSYDLVSWLDLSLNDYFYEYTNENVDTLKSIMNEFPPLNNNQCTIKSMKSSKYKLLWESSMVEHNKKIKRVMLIGNFFRYSSFSSATAVFPTLQLYIELSLIKKMRQKGYRVIYKMHPANLEKRIGPIKTLKTFESLLPKGVQIDTGRFEDSIDQADAFAFYYTGTSTFGPALVSKKPIFFYDIHLRKYPKIMTDFLNRSCYYEVFNTFNSEYT